MYSAKIAGWLVTYSQQAFLNQLPTNVIWDWSKLFWLVKYISCTECPTFNQVLVSIQQVNKILKFVHYIKIAIKPYF